MPRAGLWVALGAMVVGPFIALATFASTFFLVESADRECLDRAAQLAPDDVLRLNERNSTMVTGELTELPLGIRCSWPTERGTVWTDDGWGRTLIAWGGIATGVAGAAVLFRRMPEAADGRVRSSEPPGPSSSRWM